MINYAEKTVIYTFPFQKTLIFISVLLKIIKLNTQNLNALVVYFIDLFRSISNTDHSLQTHDLFRCIGSLIYKNGANLSKNVS